MVDDTDFVGNWLVLDWARCAKPAFASSLSKWMGSQAGYNHYPKNVCALIIELCNQSDSDVFVDESAFWEAYNSW